MAPRISFSRSAYYIARCTPGPRGPAGLPPGYLDAVRYNLAVRLAIEWQKQGAILNPGVAELASESPAKIQRRNAPTPQMDCNPAVLPIGAARLEPAHRGLT